MVFVFMASQLRRGILDSKDDKQEVSPTLNNYYIFSFGKAEREYEYWNTWDAF